MRRVLRSSGFAGRRAPLLRGRLGRMLLVTGLAAALALPACRGPARRDAAAQADPLARLVDSLRAPVERATGLRFRTAPRSALRSREQVRGYLTRKLDEELPPARLQGLETAYRLFGLLPDTLRLRALLLDLYTEQVAGYYDADSAMLFGVAGADPLQLKVVVAHELVHALQGQYMPLDSVLEQTANNDRLTAAQAVLEGQATLASIRALVPGGQDPTANPQFWSLFREQIRERQSSMPVFGRAPLLLREALIFPYLAGADFMRWWASSPHADTVPYGARMPTSTEQILYPDRYARGDRPVAVAFAGGGARGDRPGSDTAADRGRLSGRPAADTSAAGDDVIYEDVLGESEIRILLARLSGSDEVQTVVPLGWGGDRYRVYRTPDGPALVWYVVWDMPAAAERFVRVAGAGLRSPGRDGYRATLDTLTLAGRPATRYVLAPLQWTGWSTPPQVQLAATDGRL